MDLLLITVIATVIGTLLAIEAKAWMPYLSARILRGAIARFPEALARETRERWAEEIEADLAAYGDRPLGGLAFALRLRRRGGRRLAGELALAETVEAKPAAADDGDQPNVRSEEGRTMWVGPDGGHDVTYTADGRKVYVSYKHLKGDTRVTERWKHVDGPIKSVYVNPPFTDTEEKS